MDTNVPLVENKASPQADTFPVRLMQFTENKAFEDAIWWSSHGHTICINTSLFEEKIIKQHFRGTKFESFARRLRRWGFKRIIGASSLREVHMYRHPSFQRGNTQLLRTMCLAKTKIRLPNNTKWLTEVQPACTQQERHQLSITTLEDPWNADLNLLLSTGNQTPFAALSGLSLQERQIAQILGTYSLSSAQQLHCELRPERLIRPTIEARLLNRLSSTLSNCTEEPQRVLLLPQLRQVDNSLLLLSLIQRVRNENRSRGIFS